MLITKATTCAIIALAAIGVMSVHPMMAKARQTKQSEDVAAVTAAARARYDAIDQAFEHHDAAAAFKLMPRVVIGPQNHLVPDGSVGLDQGEMMYVVPWRFTEWQLQANMDNGAHTWRNMKHDIGTITVRGNAATVAIAWSFAPSSGISPEKLAVIERFIGEDTWVKGVGGWELQLRTINAESVGGADGKPNAYIENRMILANQIRLATSGILAYRTGLHDYCMPPLEGSTPYEPFHANATLSNLPYGKVTAIDPHGDRIPVLYEAAPDKEGKHLVSFIDGHVDLLTSEQWTALANITKILIKK